MWLDKKKWSAAHYFHVSLLAPIQKKKYAVGENLTLMQLSIFMLSLKNRDVKVYTTVFMFFTDAN